MASSLSSEIWELREGLNVPPVPWIRDKPLPTVEDPCKAERDRKYAENEARIRELRQQRKVLRMKAERMVAREKEGLPSAGMTREQLIKHEAEVVMNDMAKVVDSHVQKLEQMKARMEKRRSNPAFAGQNEKIEALRRSIEHKNAQYELERTQRAEAAKKRQEEEVRRQREKHDEIIAKREESERAKGGGGEETAETEEKKSATEERLERLEREAREERERGKSSRERAREEREGAGKSSSWSCGACGRIHPPPPAPAQPATSIPITDDSFDEDPPVANVPARRNRRLMERAFGRRSPLGRRKLPRVSTRKVTNRRRPRPRSSRTRPTS